MGKYDDRDYKVGKGKPPQEHQFKKGFSGNPRGPRHKKKAQEATIDVLAHEAVNEMVPVFMGGRQTMMPKKQAIIVGIVNDALTGTPAQRIKALKVLQEIGAFNPVEDERLTPELQTERMSQFIAALIEEGKRDETTRHLFAEYE